MSAVCIPPIIDELSSFVLYCPLPTKDTLRDFEIPVSIFRY